jgi:ABC-type arginine transport system permease subunit
MRISANTASPDYRSDYMGASIYLDGVLVDRVIAVDDIAGEVTRARLDELGNIYLAGDGIATEVLKGSVRIVKYGSWRCAEAIGFDAWMRARTEAAHQAMMKHARRGATYPVLS